MLSPVVLAALLVMLALVVIPASEAQVATTRTIDVDNIDDDNPAAGCSLREAIDVANAGIGAGMAANGCTVVESGTGMSITYKINLPSYTYTLSGTAGNDDNTGGDLDIMANVMIMGMGAGSTIIDGNGIDRVIHLPIAGLGITLHISDVTIQNGYVAGNENGGGIHNNGGAVNISNSIIVNNRAGDEGGGIFNWAGRLIISDCTISNNESQGAWGGGGIKTVGSSNIGADMVTVTNSTIIDNQASYGGGISISTDVGTTNIVSCTISNNRANYGGGIFNDTCGMVGDLASMLNIRHSTISNNIVDINGGGFALSGNYATTTTVNIANSTISGNSADQHGGGMYIDNLRGPTGLTNVTIFGNVADADGDGNGDGGGINDVDYDPVDGDDVRSVVNIKNSVVAGNSDQSGGNHDCFGAFTSLRYNLIGKNTGCIPSFPPGNPNGNNDFVGTGAIPLDPILGPLTYNGGDTWTHALLPGSPAIDSVPVVSCTLTTDQRGVPRPYGMACDIGAYERFPGPILALTKEADDDMPLPSQVITFTVSVENSGDLTATNAFISDTLPTGLVFAGPVVLEPSEAGSTGVYPILAQSLTITIGQRITATFPVTVQAGVVGVITNTAVISSTELIAPQVGSKAIAVGYRVYLPVVFRNYICAP